MKFLVAALLVGVCAASFIHEPRQTLNSMNFVHELNAEGGWRAGMNKRFEHVTFEDAKGLLGLKKSVHPEAHAVSYAHLTKYFTLPKEYDPRKTMPECIHPVRDQASCGSCWAFGASEALSDRVCIASDKKINVILSPQDLVSCDTSNMGCQGGYLDKAWNYMAEFGIVSESCFPYSSASGSVEECATTCKDGSEWKKFKVQPGTVQLYTDVETIKMELIAHGPMEAGFAVYEDFYYYKGGVYYHKSGGLAGYHAVKLIGWGVEDGVEYWIIQNSWNESWGEAGYFRIKAGTNECEIETMNYAGLVAL